jgi:hypothetical protein
MFGKKVILRTTSLPDVVKNYRVAKCRRSLILRHCGWKDGANFDASSVQKKNTESQKVEGI